MKKSFFVIAFLLLASFLPAQTADTINIHRPVVFGITYRKCMKIWFSYKDGSFSFTHGHRRQDQVITNDSIYYFKVYGYTGKLLLEGRKEPGGELSGTVKFYYKNGKVKRTEFYRTYEDASTDTVCKNYCDGVNPWETWSYYDRKGRLRKTVIYSCDPVAENRSYHYKTITRYSKKGKELSRRKRTHFFCDP